MEAGQYIQQFRMQYTSQFHQKDQFQQNPEQKAQGNLDNLRSNKQKMMNETELIQDILGSSIKGISKNDAKNMLTKHKNLKRIIM